MKNKLLSVFRFRSSVICYQVLFSVLLFLIPNFSLQAQTAAADERFYLLPMIGYSYEQGLGIGANAAWVNIEGSTWAANTSAYVSSLYSQTFINLDVINKHFQDILYVEAGGFFDNSARSLFYGLGNNTDVANVTQYAVNDNYVFAKAGIRVYDEIIFGLGYNHRSTGINRGADPSLPQFLDQFPLNSRASGTTTTATMLFLTYDTRTPLFAPQEGNYGWVSLSQEQPRSGEDLAQQRVIVAGENYFDILGDKDLILVSRAKFEREWGENVPFFLETSVGGEDSLRGYYLNRYTDAGSMLINEETRYNIWNTGSGTISKVEVSLAFELGRVFDGTDFPPLAGYHTDWDVGLTGILEGGVPVRLDFAFSNEANLIYLHLFYPF